eukprot:c25365_g1_i1 orf=143-2239(+)
MASALVDPLDAIRPLMKSYSPPLDALIVPSEDAHQSEYVAEHDRRRAFVSGFTGSAGLAVITKNEALLWTDGRYFLQATQQLNSHWKLMRIGEDPAVESWLVDNLGKDATVGVDPWCISVETAQRWEQAFAKKGQKLVPTDRNLVDEIWRDRPEPKIFPVVIHPVKFAGLSSQEKLTELRSKLSSEKACAIVVTALDEIAWLYNLRGQDVSYNPVVHAFAIVTMDSAFLYVDKQKINPEVEEYLNGLGVEIRGYNSILADLESLASGQPFCTLKAACSKTFSDNTKLPNEFAEQDAEIQEDCKQNGEEKVDPSVSTGNNVDETLKEFVVENPTDDACKSEERNNLFWLSPGSCCYALFSKFSCEQVLLQQSPLALAKALKHPVELEGLKNAHTRDGAAMVSFLAWLDEQMQIVYGASGYFSESKESNKRKHFETKKLNEVIVSSKLEEFRARQEHFVGLSFQTISSVGPNAAIIHYAPVADSCAEMQGDSIYLCDSGGQYLDGTTDVTRTMHFGKPSAHEKACYTRVLKGHIALDTAVFPNGTNGHALDILARIPLWQDGLDYGHGTGHGVGSYLNVHEGPHLISFRPQARNVALQASMAVTDEPGYYEDGNFGVRLENVLIVKEAQTNFNFANKGYLAFEHITWVPYQKKLIDLSLLSPFERQWIDDYHVNCQLKLSPLLSRSDLAWLVKATEPLVC